MMNKRSLCTALLSGCLLLSACSSGPTDVAKSGGSTKADAKQPVVRPDKDSAYGVGGSPRLFNNMGPYQREITTDSRLAKRYFNQGLKWIYGFNHDEAVRSFTKAAELDPGCAMAWWGVAYAQGPNYNGANMNAARLAAAWEATQKALAQLDDETAVEKDLVRALAQRYSDPKAKKKIDQKQNRADFAQAMAAVWAKHPKDADVGTVYADAMMVKNPWRLYKPDGAIARDETLTIVKTLEEVFKLEPNHPGANHLYIHAVEASTDKQRGVIAADRLSTAVPMCGHLTHMPSHLYVQVGMWKRAVEQNKLAIQSDKQYLAKSPVQYRVFGYAAHNGHMLAFAAMMGGQEKLARYGAQAAWDFADPVFDTIGKRYDRAMCTRYEVLRRFGRWDEILKQPTPPKILSRATAVWRSCRAVAFAAKKDFVNAQGEHAAFKVLLKKRAKDKYLLLNDHFIAAEIALQQEKWDEAIKQLQEAAKYEDQMRYSEPPVWVQPVRHTLGAVYLKAEKPADAERVYREDLERWPNNGWSLFGLSKALEARGHKAEAAKFYAAYQKAWSAADKPLDTSCECIPKL